MSRLPMGTITFVLTDIVGSTQMWEAEPEAMSRAIARHHAIVDELARRNGGALVKGQGEGDSSFVVFERPSDAITFAGEFQRALVSEPWPTPEQLRVRIGLHTGEAELRGGDYYGRTVNRCARLRSLAAGGQVLVSGVTAQLLGGDLPEGSALRDLGLHRLRDLVQPEHVYQLCVAGLPDEFPPLRSLDTLPNNLPVYLTSFVGRERELDEVRALAGGARLVTLTGTGGAGKTRLAVHVAAELADSFADGVWVVDLAPLRDPAHVEQAVASALGVRGPAERPLTDTLVDELAGRTALLVLDNCEHLAEACARLADALLRGCRFLRIFATSREVLGVPGERIFPVPPLALPDGAASLEELARCDAVHLFIDRVSAVRPGFALTGRNAGAVAAICRRLDGIPLAIELAAARANVLTAEQIAERLDHRFRVLAHGPRTADPRQQTLRATVDWSYELLSGEERAMFGELSVFAGGFTLEAAEAVAGEKTRDAGVLELLSRLVEKSLLVAEAGDARTRYRLLETVREYAAERLAESGEEARARDEHLRWCLSLAGEAADELQGARQAQWLDLLEIEHDNIRAALAWARAAHDRESMLHLTNPLETFWCVRGYVSEGRSWVEAALAMSGTVDAPTRAGALLLAGDLAQRQGDHETARARDEEALAVSREIGDRLLVAESLVALGNVAHATADYPSARDLYEEALPLVRESGAPGELAALLSNMGNALSAQADFEGAENLYREALGLSQAVGEPAGITLALEQLGSVATMRRDYVAARRLYEEAMQSARGTGDKPMIARLLANLGAVVLEGGDIDPARVLYEESLGLRRELGDRPGEATVLYYLGEAELLAGRPDRAEVVLRAALDSFRRLGMKRGVAHVTRELGKTARASGDPSRAGTLFRGSLSLFGEMREPLGIASCLEGLAGVAGERGDHEHAALLFGAAEAARRRIGVPVPPSGRARLEEDVARAREGLGDDAFEAMRARGADTPLEDAAALAREA